MPYNNRVSSSVVLNTNDMWSKTIGHDPYASVNEKEPNVAAMSEQSESFLLLARMSKLANPGSENRGGCKRCGLLGHLTFQCHNEIKPTEQDSDSSSSDSEESVSHYVESKRLIPTEKVENKSSERKRSREDESDRDHSKQSRKHEKEKKKKHKKDKKKSSKHKKSSHSHDKDE